MLNDYFVFHASTALTWKIQNRLLILRDWFLFIKPLQTGLLVIEFLPVALLCRALVFAWRMLGIQTKMKLFRRYYKIILSMAMRGIISLTRIHIVDYLQRGGFLMDVCNFVVWLLDELSNNTSLAPLQIAPMKSPVCADSTLHSFTINLSVTLHQVIRVLMLTLQFSIFTWIWLNHLVNLQIGHSQPRPRPEQGHPIGAKRANIVSILKRYNLITL